MTTPTWDQFEDAANKGRTDIPEDFQRTRGYAAHVEEGDLVVLVNEDPEQEVDWTVDAVLSTGLALMRTDAALWLTLTDAQVIARGMAHSPRHWQAKAQAIIDAQRQALGE